MKEKFAILSYVRTFSISESLRTNQLDLLKIFVALFIVKEIHASFVESDGTKIPISDAILRKVFFIFGVYCLVAILRFAREYLLHVEQNAGEQKEKLSQEDKPMDSDTINHALLIEFARLLDLDIARSLSSHPYFNGVVCGIDFIIPVALTVFSFSLSVI